MIVLVFVLFIDLMQKKTTFKHNNFILLLLSYWFSNLRVNCVSKYRTQPVVILYKKTYWAISF